MKQNISYFNIKKHFARQRKYFMNVCLLFSNQNTLIILSFMDGKECTMYVFQMHIWNKLCKICQWDLCVEGFRQNFENWKLENLLWLHRDYFVFWNITTEWRCMKIFIQNKKAKKQIYATKIIVIFVHLTYPISGLKFFLPRIVCVYYLTRTSKFCKSL